MQERSNDAVIIETRFGVAQVLSGKTSFRITACPLRHETVRGSLARIADQNMRFYDTVLYPKTLQLREGIVVLLNDSLIDRYPKGLDTALRGRDRILILPLAEGGD